MCKLEKVNERIGLIEREASRLQKESLEALWEKYDPN
jgi:hypothetical protein